MTVVSRKGDSPFAQWERVEVVFPGENTTVEIGHALLPAKPRDVGWIVLGQSHELTVYAVDREAWPRGVVRLAATAPGTVQLLLNVID